MSGKWGSDGITEEAHERRSGAPQLRQSSRQTRLGDERFLELLRADEVLELEVLDIRVIGVESFRWACEAVAFQDELLAKPGIMRCGLPRLRFVGDAVANF